jgi:formate C-acetyltransferase
MVLRVTEEETARQAVLDPRTLALRDRVRRYEDDAAPYVRGLVATEVYRTCPDLPVVRKRAEVLARTLAQLAPVVLPEDRLICAAYRRRKVHQGVSEANAWRIQVAFPERWAFREDWPIPEPVKTELRWWQDPPLNVQTPNARRRENPWLGRYGLAWPYGMMNGHTLPDHAILLRHGIAALRRRIQTRLEAGGTPAQRDQWLAMDRCLAGLSDHALLCADAARAAADRSPDAELRARLHHAADACERLATDPPRTFHEALQLLHFSNLADMLDTPGDAASFGRVDQLLLPFYEADLARGVLTREDAFDLVAHFLIKHWTNQDSNNMTVGGVTPEGGDATNDLSTFFLEAMEATEMVSDISVRVHQGTPEAFLRTTARVVRRSFGRPSLFNDEVTISALVRKGVAPEDARDYAPLGCVEVMIPGRSSFRTMCMGLNLPKVLELMLNKGRCLVTGDLVWDDVPDTYESYEALLGAYHRRIADIVDLGVTIIHEDERVEPTVFPRPWLTVLSRGGIESGLDMTAGQPTYNPVGVTLDGLADIANSLYAVKHLVFDEQRLTLPDLREVLRGDWEGHESLRQYVLNRLPRFGQDDPIVNAIAREEAAHFAACFEEHRTFYGGRFWPMIFGVATGLLYGKSPKTGATPSGRTSGAMLAMSLQPSPAGPQGCTTAILQAAAVVDGLDYPGGISNVQECDPALVAGATGLDRLTQLIRGFFTLGGVELSMNFLDEATLRAAQSDPDRYRYLMVRVFGMSAQFVNLTPELQDTVIERVAAACRRASL